MSQTGKIVYGKHTITAASNDVIRVNLGAGDLSATIAAGTYWIGRGDGDVTDLVKAIDTALKVLDATFSAVVSSTGRVTIARTGNFTLKFADAATTFDEAQMGFANSNLSGAATYTSPSQHVGGWYPEQPWHMPGRDAIGANMSVTRAVSGVVRRTEVGTFTERVNEVEFVKRAKIFKRFSLSSEAFESAWSTMRTQEFLVFEDIDDLTLFGTYVVIDEDWCNRMRAAIGEEPMAAGEQFRVTIPMRAYVAP